MRRQKFAEVRPISFWNLRCRISICAIGRRSSAPSTPAIATRLKSYGTRTFSARTRGDPLDARGKSRSLSLAATNAVPVIWKRIADAVFGPALPRHPSRRVVRSIHQQEENSEILIGWVQIAAIIFFAVFYSTAPKAFAPDVPFAPVPVTLSAYALFTALRLVLAYRAALRTWFVALSVVIDIAVLMITIWSFHLQYDQPPTLYLKAP